jgi:MmyB-like transcription regulator ligand binding domain
VAALKHGPFRADRHVAALAGELAVTAGDDFASRAGTVPGLPVASGITRLAHPAAGELRLAFETLGLAADDDQRLVVYLAADAATSDALGRLVRSGPRPLGVVSEHAGQDAGEDVGVAAGGVRRFRR